MTKKLMRAGLVAFTIFSLTSCGEEEKPDPAKKPNEPNKPENEAVTLRFSAIPDSDTTAQAEKYAALAKYLDEKLEGVKVEFVPSADYASSVEKFSNGDIQLAWFGGVTGVQARDNVEGAEAIVAGKEDLEYMSYFIANAATGLKASDEFPAAIADLKFTFGSTSSTSGHIMPVHFIMENSGKTRDEFFSKEFGFSGAHDKTAKLVEEGAFEAGVLSYTTYEKMVKNGDLDTEKCVLVWKTPFYPDYNFTAHPDLGEELIKKIQDVLVAIDGETEEGKVILGILNRSSLVPVKSEDFEPIATVLEAVTK